MLGRSAAPVLLPGIRSGSNETVSLLPAKNPAINAGGESATENALMESSGVVLEQQKMTPPSQFETEAVCARILWIDEAKKGRKQ